MADTCQNHGTSNHAIPRNLTKCTVVLRKPFNSYACSFHCVICDFFKLFGCSWNGMGHSVGMARFGRSFVVCLIGRGPPTIYSFQETPK